MFRQLYDIEDRAKDLSSEQRLAMRQTMSTVVLKRMREYLDSDAVQLPSVLPKSDFAQAVTVGFSDAVGEILVGDPAISAKTNEIDHRLRSFV